MSLLYNYYVVISATFMYGTIKRDLLHVVETMTTVAQPTCKVCTGISGMIDIFWYKVVKRFNCLNLWLKTENDKNSHN